MVNKQSNYAINILLQLGSSVMVLMGRNKFRLNPNKIKWFRIRKPSDSRDILSLVLDIIVLPHSEWVCNLEGLDENCDNDQFSSTSSCALVTTWCKNHSCFNHLLFLQYAAHEDHSKVIAGLECTTSSSHEQMMTYP